MSFSPQFFLFSFFFAERVAIPNFAHCDVGKQGGFRSPFVGESGGRLARLHDCRATAQVLQSHPQRHFPLQTPRRPQGKTQRESRTVTSSTKFQFTTIFELFSALKNAFQTTDGRFSHIRRGFVRPSVRPSEGKSSREKDS